MNGKVSRYGVLGLGLSTFALGLTALVTAQGGLRPGAGGEPPPLVQPGHRYDLPATLVTAEEIEKHKQRMVAIGATDIAMTMVKAGGGSADHQVGISVVNRYFEQVNANYAVHDDVAEVYYVLEGRGRMKLGGKITDWERRPYSAWNGWGSRGTTAVGSQDMTIKKGDMLIVPAGTPHKWDFAEEFTSYIVVRVDPSGIAPLMELGTAEYPRR
jgi:mannose-6-phosphate isomerase-like protein (cupin superfamily)